MSRPMKLCAALLSVLVLGACASLPEPGHDAYWWGMLPEEADFYAYLKVESHRDVLALLLSNLGGSREDVDAILRSTGKVVVAGNLDDQPEQASSGDLGVGVSAVALGEFSSMLMSIRMNTDGGWSQTIAGTDLYWTHRGNHVKISFPADGVIFFTNGDMEDLLRRWRDPSLMPLPLELSYAMRVSDLVVFFPRFPQSMLERFDLRINVPIRAAWFGVSNTGETYDIDAVFELESEEQARSFAAVAKLALLIWMRQAEIPDAVGRMRGIVLKPEGTVVRLSGLSFTTDEVNGALAAVVQPWLATTGVAPTGVGP